MYLGCIAAAWLGAVLVCHRMLVVLSADLCERELELDLQRIKRTLGAAYARYESKGFSVSDVVFYYRNTTQRDYKKLERVLGPGMHTRLRTKEPIKDQWGGMRQAALVLSEIGKIPNHRVLEIGCGKGHCSLALASIVDEISFEGMDLLEDHVLQARANAELGMLRNVTFFQGDACSMDHSRTGYGLVFGCESLCHVADMGGIDRLVHRVSDMLVEGGLFIVIDGFRCAQFDNHPAQYRQAMLLAESGFRINRMYSTNEWAVACSSHGLRLISGKDLTEEAIPFWAMGWRMARLAFLFPSATKWYMGSSAARRETVSNMVSITTVAHAMGGGTAEYCMLVFRKK